MKYQRDFYAKKAKQEGYSARSVYKLQEIHAKKLKTLHNAARILDLGAAPGSWSQYLQKHISMDAQILAIDIQEISAKFLSKPQITCVQADFTDQAVIEEKILPLKFDFIFSDAAPLTTGNRNTDTARSEHLVEVIAYIAEHCLHEHGTMVAKLFQGSGAATLIKDLKGKFVNVSCIRPQAVTQSSFETYLVCSKILRNNV